MILTLERLAAEIFFGKIKTNEDLQEAIKGQWEFRKGKGIADINKATLKGKKMGNYKTEQELEWIAFYLKDVFKEVKPMNK